jgi:tetratricopeptide (TPR) repeat protein
LDAITNKLILLDKCGESKQEEAKSMARTAIDIYDKILKKRKDDIDALVGKAIALDILGDKNKAIDWYDKAIGYDRNNAFAWYNKSCTLALLKRENEALDALRKAIRFSPSYRNLAKKDKDFDELRKNKRFVELLERDHASNT